MKSSFIGQPVGRIDGLEKATGEAKFLRDLRIPGMLHAKVVRSPHPHARIVSVDAERAKRLPGVKSVITAAETPQIKFAYVPHMADKLPLAREYVRFIGDEVAAVAAVDRDTAEEAASLIKVAYEELPAIFSPEEALAPHAPRIHGGDSNVAMKICRDFGDVEEGFAVADEIFEERFSTQRVAHCCLEARGCIASFSMSGKLTLWSTTQTPYALRNELARVLGVAPTQVRVLKTHMGGGFGSRLVMDMIEPIAALLSKRTGRPVALFNTREEEFHYSCVRYPFVVELKTGVRRDGTLVARKANVILDNGAYHDRGPSTLANAAMSFMYLYRTSHIKFDGALVYTNTLHGAAFRGFGNPQITFAMECQMDTIAEKLGIDPVQIRLRNIVRPGEKTASGATIASAGLSQCIEQAVRESGWTPGQESKREPHVGTGMAIMIHSGGGVRIYKYNAAEAFIKVDQDGRANVLVGVSEHGQGATTVLAQIVAEETGIALSEISISETDTDVNPMDLGAYASRTTYILGNTVRSGACEIRKQLVETAALAVGAKPEEMEIHGGMIFVAQAPERSISVKEAIRTHYARGLPLSGTGRFVDPIPPDLDPATGQGDFSPVYSFSCVVAKVKVNPNTGEIKVLSLVSANDLGKVINRLGAEGQVEGASLQGIGYALLEETLFERGKILNGNLLDYKLPTSLDLSALKSILVESDEASGPYGAKGVGESAIVAVAPAIANAVYDAVGVRFKDLPLSKERVYEGLNARPRPTDSGSRLKPEEQASKADSQVQVTA